MSVENNWTRFYVPEIHDVWPGMEAELDAMLDVLPTAARSRCALLVVPDWQQRAPLAGHPNFVERVAGEAGDKVLHGLTHSLGPDLLNWLLYGHDNRSEFARLTDQQATDRLSRGVAAMQSSFGARPRWFCAPRWQQSVAVPAVLERLGFHGWMTNGALRRFDGAAVPLPALNFDEGDRKLKNAIMHPLREPRLARIVREATPVRVALHPADVHDATAWRQVRALMTAFERDGWTALSVDEAVALWDRDAAMAPS